MDWLRRFRVLISLLVVAGLAALGIQRLLAPKQRHPAWQPLSIGRRDAVGIAIGGDGAIYVASNAAGSGDVLRSTDDGRTWTPMQLRSEAVWNVQWLPRARLLCASSREGLYCYTEQGWASVFTGVDTYFVSETSGGTISGGHPSLMTSDADLGNARVLTSVSYAVRSAVESHGRLFIGGSTLRISDNGGSIREVSAATDAITAIAADGARVYIAGGTFGGFVLRSDDRGERWRSVQCPAKQPERLWVMPQRPDVVLMADHGDIREGDLFLSTDGGDSWVGLGCPGSEVHAVAMDERFIYCGATSMSGSAGLWRRPRAGLLPQ